MRTRQASLLDVGLAPPSFGTLALPEENFNLMAENFGVTEFTLGWLKTWGERYPELPEYLLEWTTDLAMDPRQEKFAELAGVLDGFDLFKPSLLESNKRLFEGRLDADWLEQTKGSAQLLDAMGLSLSVIFNTFPTRYVAIREHAIERGADPTELMMLMSAINAYDQFRGMLYQIYYLESRESKLTDLERVRTVASELTQVAQRLDNLAHGGGDGQDGLEETVEAARGRLDELVELSNGVGKVTTLIRGVADQTHLLSLNATIEAARAGEQGKGFAVVANEVKNLASTTMESLGSIEELTESIQLSITDMTTAVDRIVGVAANVSSESSVVANMAEDLSTT